MNRRALTLTALLFLSLLIPAAPLWAGHDMGEMGGSGKTINLEGSHQDGVMAMATLHDVREAMAKHGMKETHHMMVMFTDMKDNKPLIEGTVAVKVIDPAGAKGEPLKMILMGDGFGTDVALAAPGKYGFEVGTKLADGKRRVFTFTLDKK